MRENSLWGNSLPEGEGRGEGKRTALQPPPPVSVHGEHHGDFHIRPHCHSFAFSPSGRGSHEGRAPNYSRQRSQSGSVLVIVLLICFGLISMAIYFANSMTMELRASDNRVCGMSADQAIEGAARYMSTVLTTFATNGAMPNPSEFPVEAVPVGAASIPEQNAHYWLIGRETNGAVTTEPFFGLIDESSKLNLNASWVTADVLTSNMPINNISYDFGQAAVEWRTTNSANDYAASYSQYGYTPKQGPFETVGELRLIYGATKDMLYGEDLNLNGVLDANERDLNSNGQADPGLLELCTVYSRQPNAGLTNVNTSAQITSLLQNTFGATRANTILARLGFTVAGGGGGGGRGGGGFGGGFGGGGGGGAAATPNFPSLLAFFRRSGMTSDEFAQIYNSITVTNTAYTVGRVNINTAPAAVLACLPGMDLNTAQQVVTYRQGNPGALGSIAWIADALSNNTGALTQLQAGDYITTHTYQFTADIAALGAYGRGYRRVRFVFDLSSGSPQIVFRQDLSRLGWALGRGVRQTWVTKSI